MFPAGKCPLRRFVRKFARKRTVWPRKGAFTGAIYNRKGRFEMADNGTIFLTKLLLSSKMQIELLRVLESKALFGLVEIKR
ncbi:MAG: sigma 54-interacting transcriptional regulator [Draconibacterium sp.]|nr:sigma 54-interacting transcriptional regulator [Draconibacterium sp.]